MMNIKLQTGILNIKTEQPQVLSDLAGFGSRINPKRGFVFVSKVLGKHYPAQPSELHKIYQKLAAKIKPKLLPGPTMVIGFAETATGLGQGVYEQLGLEDGFYIHTTRYKLSQPIWLDFQEEHSHATEHFLYQPQASLKALQENLVNIVLVDDEFSTGRTVENILVSLKAKCPQVKKFISAGILSWMQQPLAGIDWVSLHQGQFDFDPKPISVTPPPAVGLTPVLDELLPYNFARYGIQQLALKIPTLPDCKGQKVLCLGTSEYIYPAYKLAEYLTTTGAECYVQSTTRSPLNIDADITNKLTFIDNYGENINHYLYNIAHYDKILVCYETQTLAVAHDLLQQLAEFSPQIYPLFLQPQ